MEKMFINSDDTNVAVRMIYAKSDGVAYVDATLKTKATPDELLDAFYKGMIVVDATKAMYRPVSCKSVSGTVTVTYATTDTSTATTAKLATVKAEPAE